MIRGIAAAAAQPVVSSAASAALAAGGSAVDAVIAGFFAAAGADPSVLLAPAVALVAGFGAGARAFDGRSAQPGKGAARPRGFLDEASVPGGARVAAPRTIAMLMLLHTSRGRAPLRDLARAGVAAAEAVGSSARAKLIRRVGAAGVLALRAPEVQRPLLAAGGPMAGGILTAADLEEALPAETDADVTLFDDALRVYTPPFPPGDQGTAEVVVACDGRGVLAALAWMPARGGVSVPDLDIALGRDAIPVMRGVTRTAPGTPLAAPAPIAVVMGSAGFAAVVGAPDRARIPPERLRELAFGMAMERVLAELGGRTAAVVTDGRTARSPGAPGADREVADREVAAPPSEPSPSSSSSSSGEDMDRDEQPEGSERSPPSSAPDGDVTG